MKKRRDAYPVAKRGDITGLFPFLMKRRSDSHVYIPVQIDVEPLLDFIEKTKAEGREITFFQFYLAAIVRLLNEREQMNRYVMGRTVYQREDVSATIVVKREMNDAADEVSVTMHFPKGATFDDVVEKLSRRVTAVKKEGETEDSFIMWLMKLPRFILMFIVKVLEWMDFHGILPAEIEKIDPIRCSAFISNLGSIGIDAPYHHLYEWGTCSLFTAIGRIQKMPVVVGDELVLKKMVEVKVSIDERIAHGFYFARSLDVLKKYFEEPEKFIQEMNKQTVSAP